jgi:hypothetical protein
VVGEGLCAQVLRWRAKGKVYDLFSESGRVVQTLYDGVAIAATSLACCDRRNGQANHVLPNCRYVSNVTTKARGDVRSPCRKTCRFRRSAGRQRQPAASPSASAGRHFDPSSPTGHCANRTSSARALAGKAGAGQARSGAATYGTALESVQQRRHAREAGGGWAPAGGRGRGNWGTLQNIGDGGAERAGEELGMMETRRMGVAGRRESGELGWATWRWAGTGWMGQVKAGGRYNVGGPSRGRDVAFLRVVPALRLGLRLAQVPGTRQLGEFIWRGGVERPAANTASPPQSARSRLRVVLLALRLFADMKVATYQP